MSNINITTGKDEAKLLQCIIGIEQLGHDIGVLTETHKIGSGVIDTWPKKANLEGWKLHYSGFDREARAGVAVACSERCEVIDWEIVEKARIIYIRMKFMGVKLQLLAVYGPTNVKSDAKKSDFYSKLNKAMKKFKKE